jgi:hypothetical protein
MACRFTVRSFDYCAVMKAVFAMKKLDIRALQDA